MLWCLLVLIHVQDERLAQQVVLPLIHRLNARECFLLHYRAVALCLREVWLMQQTVRSLPTCPCVRVAPSPTLEASTLMVWQALGVGRCKLEMGSDIGLGLFEG